MKIEDPTVNELIMAEQTTGDAGWSLYQSYARYNGGIIWILVIFFSMFGWMISNTCFNIWLSIWTTNTPPRSNGYYVGFYALFGVIYGLFAFFRALVLAISTPKMSLVIHESMISNLLFSPLNEFFDRVPQGRILNRLSKDLNSVDANLAVVFANFLVFLFFLICNIVVIIYCTNIWISVPIAVFLLGIVLLKNYYMKPNRELVRL
jgi:ATP-binding cassette subfamily C (CFTR/MRP) protein 1